MLRGALAAAVTPLRDELLDADAVGPYVDFLASHRLDGVLVLGTTGEGVMFPPAQPKDPDVKVCDRSPENCCIVPR